MGRDALDPKTLAFDCLKRHFLRFASGLAFPGREQLRVRFFEVAFDRDIQALGRGVNPFGLALDLAEVPDGRFVDYDMAVRVGPFTAEFLIAEAGAEADRFNDPGHGFAIFDLRLNLAARLVPPRLPPASVLVSNRPARAVFPKPEQGSPTAKFAAKLVIKRIHLMGSGSHQAESSRLKTGGQGVNVVDPKLDLDFAIRGHAASIKKRGSGKSVTICGKGRQNP
jgi:hypothetical protein